MNPKEAVIYIHKLLTENNINFLLECGGLLFFIRDGLNDIKTNDDFDFAIHEDDINKVKKLILNDKNLNPYLKVKKEWRKELSVYINKFQIDFYSFSYDKKWVYHYFYAKNKNDNGKWTLGYRIKFPIKSYFPLQTVEFLGLKWKCCNDFEKKFELHYGKDWKKPKKQFFGIENIPCFDKEYLLDDKNWQPIIKRNTDIGIVLTTFLRDEVIFKTLKHYSEFPYKIYLGDQGFFTLEKENIYDEYRKQGHSIIYLPFDCGLSYARNVLVNQVLEPFTFITDDDIHIRTNLDSYLKHFEKKELGIVGGKIYNHYSHKWQNKNKNLILEDNILYYISPKGEYCDVVLNFFLARTKIFQDIAWDEKQKMVEHSDFFLRLKYLDKWKVKYDATLVGDHYMNRDEIYAQLRGRQQYLKQFKEKWLINNISGG